MKWHEFSLGKALKIKHGYAFKSEFFVESGQYIVLTPGNFYEEGGFKLRPEKDRAYSGDISDHFILSQNDLIVAMTEQAPGLLGSSALIPENDKFLHNQRLGLIEKIDKKLLNKFFLYYLFNTYSVRGQISGSASGTKVRHTSPDRIYKVRVKVPDIPTQEKIANILSKYDDLIENNRRRIELLEKSARLLYKEWFVYLRFPGYEHTPIIDGVPDGWERKRIEEVGYLNYGKTLLKDNRIPGKYPVFGSAGIIGTHEKCLVKAPGIIVGRKGNVGSVFYSQDDYYPIDTTYYINSEQTNLYLYHTLLNTHFINTDVAVPGLNRKIAHSIKILVPNTRIKNVFEELVQPLYQQTSILTKQNQKLKQARDILLPRLMNGEINV